MDELVAWLRDQVDADERVARAAAEGGHPDWAHHPDDYWFITDGTGEVVVYGEGRPRETEAAHIARHDPARVLAEVAAKRRIIDRHPAIPPTPGHWSSVRTIWWCPTCSDADDGPESWPCPTIQAVASVYAGRPGWREEWAQDEEEHHHG